ncbi:flagellar basal body-associated FliL family protein [bacterium]|nr:flagellar basal body-associated FliL family protein [bacterium]
MADEEEENTEGGEEEPKKGSKMLLIIIAVVVLLVLGGGGAAFFLLGGEEEKKEDGEPVDITYKTVEMRPFIVNLADNTSYIKLVLLLEYDPTLVGGGGGAFGGGGSRTDPISGKLPGDLKEREAMIRDAVISLVGGKTRQELLTAEGKDTLKEELLEVINDASGLDEAAIVGVYFLEFIIQ